MGPDTEEGTRDPETAKLVAACRDHRAEGPAGQPGANPVGSLFPLPSCFFSGLTPSSPNHLKSTLWGSLCPYGTLCPSHSAWTLCSDHLILL